MSVHQRLLFPFKLHNEICIFSLFFSRSLTPAMMTWVAKTGRFVFHKDTSLDIKTMIEKLKAVQAIPGTTLK